MRTEEGFEQILWTLDIPAYSISNAGQRLVHGEPTRLHPPS